MNVALAALGLALLIYMALDVTEAPELAPLAATDAQLRHYAEAGYYPLAAAASAAGRHALASGANLQTFGSLCVIFMSLAYGGWRGFSNPRARGWSNAFWIAAVMGLALAPHVFDGLTLQTLDYALTSAGLHGGGPHGFEPAISDPIHPAALLIERGLFAALFAAFFLVLGHDLGYRAREALVDFGFIEEDEERERSRPRKPFSGKGFSRRFVEDAASGGGDGSAFGQRRAASRPAPLSEEGRARTVLGVSASAGRKEIERAYRAQIKRAHPDHGGSVERAAALNAARDLLLGR